MNTLGWIIMPTLGVLLVAGTLLTGFEREQARRARQGPALRRTRQRVDVVTGYANLVGHLGMIGGGIAGLIACIMAGPIGWLAAIIAVPVCAAFGGAAGLVVGFAGPPLPLLMWLLW